MNKWEIPTIGCLPSGENNTITDVSGVTVGQVTLANGPIQTGVTVIKPHQHDLFQQKVPAAATILNGFGKSIGLVQLQELGVLETPIALTNTFSVAAVAQGQIQQAILANPEIGRALSTINPLVFECNDGYLNDIQAMAVTPTDYLHACDLAQKYFTQGSVGAGRGMSCFELKGGIGSSSRIATLQNGQQYRIGSLVLANFGRLNTLTIAGRVIGPLLAQRLAQTENRTAEKGSIIMLIATDAPLDARQLQRLSLRAGIGLGRTGSYFGHGSGDIALSFSTAYTLDHDPSKAIPPISLLHDALLDPIFQAVVESVEQSILHALCYAECVTGREGHQRTTLKMLAPDLMALLA